MVNGIQPGLAGLEEALAHAQGKQKAGRAEEGGADFGAAMVDAVQGVENHQAQADNAMFRVASGQETDLHGMMIALEEANIALRAMASVRDKVVEAYQQIWNMPI